MEVDIGAILRTSKGACGTMTPRKGVGAGRQSYAYVVQEAEEMTTPLPDDTTPIDAGSPPRAAPTRAGREMVSAHAA